MKRKMPFNMYFGLWLKHPGSIKEKREDHLPRHVINKMKKFRNCYWRKKYNKTKVVGGRDSGIW